MTVPESAEDVEVWIVHEEEKHPLFCNECISGYLGDGRVEPIADLPETGVCNGCGADLGKPNYRGDAANEF